MNPDFQALAALWSSKSTFAATAAGAGVTVTALVCSIQTYEKANGGSRSVVQVRVPSDQLHLVAAFAHEPVTTSVLTSSLPVGLEPMDLVVLEGCHEKMVDDGRVFLNVKAIRLSQPWRQVVADAAVMSKELVPMPLPAKDGVSRPFIIYSGSVSNPLFYKTVPGLHRKVTWATSAENATWVNKKKKNVTERRLMLTLEQFQWQTKAEANANAKPLVMRMPIWDRSCRQLFGGDEMRRWTSIITANPIPFWAVVSVDGEHSGPDLISLSTLAVHWDLRTYLESSCLELTADQMQTALGSSSSNKTSAKVPTGDIVNVTDSGVVPQGKKWRYYAMTANRAKTFEELQEPMVLYAATTTVAIPAASLSTAKGPVKKKAKPEPKQEAEEEKNSE